MIRIYYNSNIISYRSNIMNWKEIRVWMHLELSYNNNKIIMY
jgi:hypothetical protein